MIVTRGVAVHLDAPHPGDHRHGARLRELVVDGEGRFGHTLGQPRVEVCGCLLSCPGWVVS